MSILKKIFSTNAHWRVNKEFAKAYGLEASIIISELIDKWISSGKKEWFSCTADEIETATTLSYYKQKLALKVLISNGVIESRNFGVPPKQHFKISEGKILKVFDTYSIKRVESQCNDDEISNLKEFENQNSKNLKIEIQKISDLKLKKFENQNLKNSKINNSIYNNNILNNNINNINTTTDNNINTNNLKKEKKLTKKEKKEITEIENIEDGNSKMPDWETFWAFLENYILKRGEDPNLYKKSAQSKYDSWAMNDWRNGFNKPIINWKSTAINNFIHFKKDEPTKDHSPIIAGRTTEATARANAEVLRNSFEKYGAMYTAQYNSIPNPHIDEQED